MISFPRTLTGLTDVVGAAIANVVVTGGAVVIVGLGVFFFSVGLLVPAVIAAGFLVGLSVYAGFTPRRVRSIGYQLRDDDLVFRRGILFQRFVAVPYGRMQLVDVTN